MVNAYKDENGVSTMTGVSSSDGKTIMRMLADPTTHRLKVSDGILGTDHGPANGLHDENSVSTLIAVSSQDGKTPVTLYVDSNGFLLIDSV